MLSVEMVIRCRWDGGSEKMMLAVIPMYGISEVVVCGMWVSNGNVSAALLVNG